MITNNFIVRKSGLKEDIYYIDYQGEYKLKQISTITGINMEKLTNIYETYKAFYDETIGVYYFNSVDKAEAVIEELLKLTKLSKNVKTISLTEEEIEYIRRALINEDSNVIFTKAKIRDSIFNKLNS